MPKFRVRIRSFEMPRRTIAEPVIEATDVEQALAFAFAGTAVTPGAMRPGAYATVEIYRDNGGDIYATYPEWTKTVAAPLGAAAQGSRVLFLRGSDPGTEACRDLLAASRVSMETLTAHCERYAVSLAGHDGNVPEYACSNSISWVEILDHLSPADPREYVLAPSFRWAGAVLEAARSRTFTGGVTYCPNLGCSGTMTHVRIGSLTLVPGRMVELGCPVCAHRGWYLET